MQFKYFSVIGVGLFLSACGGVGSLEQDYEDCVEKQRKRISTQEEHISELKSELDDGYIVKRTRTDICTKYRTLSSGRSYCSSYHYETDYIPIDHSEWRAKIRSAKAGLVEVKSDAETRIGFCANSHNSEIVFRKTDLLLAHNDQLISLAEKIAQAEKNGDQEAVEKYRIQIAKLELEYEQKVAELPELK